MMHKEDKPPICYMGHEDCYDNHTSERLADEADWEEERQRDMNEAADRLIKKSSVE
jgi:hypothetical protein